MSAIAGIMSFDGKDIPEEKISIIKKVSSVFCTDRTDEVRLKGIYFSCSHQYFTKEAKNDISPILSDDNDLLFNADIFLFNRTELIDNLALKVGVDRKSLMDKGDAELAYYMYLQYGIGFVNMLSGEYSIIIYDKKLLRLFLIVDHIGGRHLAYAVIGQKLYYSTTLHVISALMEDELELDEEWISAAYMDFAPDTEKIHGRSPYKNVFRVEPAHYIEVSLGEENSDKVIDVKNIEYWNPVKTVKPLKLKSDEEYCKLFKDTFNKSVCGMLRAAKKHGIFLSGGLDSSSVASLAAAELAKSGEKLYSYTQVPSPDYKCEDSRYSIENETDIVLKNKEKYPNIECSFVQSKDLTSYSEPEKYIRCFAQPVKPILNSPYIYSMGEKVKNDGISIVLTGSAGNQTISYGNITTFIYQKNRGFHFISSIKEADAFCKVRHGSRVKLLEYYISRRLKACFKKIEIDSFIKPELMKKYGLKKLFRKRYKKIGSFEFDTYKKWKSMIFDLLHRQHLSYFKTCRSLFNGAIYLDPTSTKEMIELCIALPIDCFVGGGTERRAVRDYMRGIVSDDILNNIARGVQASDYLFRTNKYWDQTKDVLFDNLTAKELDIFFDRKKVDNLIEELKSKEYNMDRGTIATASIASVLGCFLKNYKRFCREEKWTVQGQ